LNMLNEKIMTGSNVAGHGNLQELERTPEKDLVGLY